MSYNDLFQIDATMVANEFLDEYMPSANGDYVKVYLYLLRNRINGIDVETIAEHLQLTEGDVRRAIKYWEKCGIVSIGSGSAENAQSNESHIEADIDAAEDIAEDNQETKAEKKTVRRTRKKVNKEGTAAEETVKAETAPAALDENNEIRNKYRRADGRDALNRLGSDLEFKQLLFIVQKYRSTIMTESEQQIFAYLYDGLHLPCEVLDYLVQYCVETKHNNMRYIEKTGLDWARLGIRTVKEAQRRTRDFDKAREESSKKKTAKKEKAGITRTQDLDEWLNQVVQRNIQ